MLIIEGGFYALMVGTAETFALFFAVKRGLSATQIGLATTLPVLLGAIAQWLVPCRIETRYLKPAMQFCQALQILALSGFIFAFHSSNVFFFPWILISLSLYWIGGLVASPLWLDWAAPWLPRRRFGSFLAKRSGIIAFVTLIAFVSAAFFAHTHGGIEAATAVFAFGILARTISFFTMGITPNPPHPLKVTEDSEKQPSLRKSKPVFYIILFTVLYKLAVSVSSPFCLPYLLRELHLSLPQYVFITAIPFMGRYLSLSNWGLAARTLRPFVGLQVAMLVISMNPILWSLTRDVRMLGAYELVSGLMWGGFELCAILVVQNFWPGNARRLLGWHMALSNGAALLGACVGSYLQSHGWNYSDIFFLSADMRFLVATGFVFVLWSLPETRIPLKVYGNFLGTLLTIRPSIANVGRVLPLRRGRLKGWMLATARKPPSGG